MTSRPELPPSGGAPEAAGPAVPAPAALAEAVADWCRQRRVPLCVLFGSRADDAQRPESDVDLALWSGRRELGPAERLEWHRELTSRLEVPVHLVVVGPHLDPVLGLQIARQGRALHALDDSAWPRERLRLWHLYQDSRPFLAAARARLRSFAGEVRPGP